MSRLLLSFLMIMLVGCGPKRPFVSQPVRPVYPLLTDEERARLHDIPFPLSSTVHKLSLEAHQAIITLSATQSRAELIAFYKAHMDYAGWREESLMEAEETCMVFHKPSKDCIITLRSEQGQICVVIFVRKKTPSRGSLI